MPKLKISFVNNPWDEKEIESKTGKWLRNADNRITQHNCLVGENTVSWFQNNVIHI